jgi:RNA polymerase sigma-70 factor (sigma-E family)
LDTGEFTQFASARSAALFRTAYALTGDWHRAEDLVQDTLGRLYVRWSKVSRADDPAAYATTTLVHLFISGRRRRSSTERPRAEITPEQPAADDDVTLRLTMLAALAALDRTDRAALVLRYCEDLDAATSADLLRTTPEAVRTRCRRALARLRELLGDTLSDLRSG